MGPRQRRTKRRLDASFVGLYNISMKLKTGDRVVKRRVFIDNDEFNKGIYKLTDEEGNTTTFRRDDVARYNIDCKDCQR